MPLARLMVPNLPTRCTPMAAPGRPASGGQAVAQEPVQAEVIVVSLAYQYRVKPLASASTGPIAVLIFSSASVPDGLIPELPPIELDLVDMAEADLVPLMVLAEVPGEVLLPHEASARAGMARAAGAHLR